MPYSLKDLDGMSIDAAQVLSFEERDGLLRSTEDLSDQIGYLL